MELLNQFSEILFRNSLSIIGSIAMTFGFIAIISVNWSKLSTKGHLIQTRQHKSAISERMQLKFGFYSFGFGLLLVLIGQLSFFDKSPSNINFADWEGEWSVGLEEYGDFAFTAGGLEIVIENDGGEIKGTVYDGRKEQGFLSKIQIDQNFMHGDYGRNDGKKMEFEFLMFPDKRSFLGRYKLRHGADPWKAWVSHRVR